MMVAWLLLCLCIQLICLAVRALYILLAKPRPLQPKRAVKTMMNAGGHTAEMLMLVEGLDKAYYSPRVYVAAETDAMSAKRALTRESTWAKAQVTTLAYTSASRRATNSSHFEQLLPTAPKQVQQDAAY
eukprot:GHUV01034902.1.p1 GENE.GHUV01034902.1~~GHUV01034902.1.p1  ORF type:complete len:129 (+),score=13.99 GHUV01034902.1:265-651(+)